MILAAIQPGYLPWLGFFEQALRGDRFLICDELRYERYSWRNRNRVKVGGAAVWLTVPVAGGGDFRRPISEIEIASAPPWRQRHRRTLEQAYARARWFEEYAAPLLATFDREWRSLAALDLHLIRHLIAAFGIETELLVQSELGLERRFRAAGGGDATERILFFCRELGADVFYNGAAGRSYIEVDRLAAAGVEVRFQEYRHPVYPQRHGPFVPHLSAVDLLFNCGPDSLEVIRAGAAG